MNTVFARVLVALSLVALPASALASSKDVKVDKAKHETKADRVKHGHAQALAKKDHPAKKAKHHGHKSKDDKAVAAFSASKAH